MARTSPRKGFECQDKNLESKVCLQWGLMEMRHSQEMPSVTHGVRRWAGAFSEAI